MKQNSTTVRRIEKDMQSGGDWQKILIAHAGQLHRAEKAWLEKGQVVNDGEERTHNLFDA